MTDYRDDDDIEMDDVELPTTSVQDEDGQTLHCYIENSMQVDGKDYVLLRPVDLPIEIFAWDEDEETEDEEMLVDIDDEEINDIFDTARAVLAEQDLTLTRSALTLTASGDVPDPGEEDIITLDLGDEGMEPEEFQLLATFFHEEQEYAICTPLDPLLFFARLSADGKPVLLSPEEFLEVRPQLEDQLFAEME